MISNKIAAATAAGIALCCAQQCRASEGAEASADAISDAARAPLKVMSIGNSFSQNAQAQLKIISESFGRRLILGNASIGGCSLERHWLNASTNGLQYGRNGENISLADYLEAEKWDIVTIQQASHFSRFPETYEPAGSNLIAFVKRHAPQAEIVVHQTWAYRADESRLLNWGISTDQMHADVSMAYSEFAARHGLRVIPCGDAFQLARKTPGWGDFTPAVGDAPASGRTLHIKDGFHASLEGSFLLGYVWQEFLFGDDVRKSAVTPNGLAPSDAAVLREIAHAAVAQTAAAIH
jgi:hypothetical protein